MDDWLQVSPGPGGDLGSRGNLLDPVIRRDIADLNLQYLQLALQPSLDEDPRFALADRVRRTLTGCPADALQRLANCPFSLFQLRLPDPPQATRESADGVADTWHPPVIEPAIAVRCQAFVLLSLSVARQLAEAAPLSPRIALGVSAEAERRLASMGPSELALLAAWSGLFRARCPRHEKFWGMLIGAARSPEPAPLRLAHCAGLCLLATGDNSADATGDAPSRRRGRPLRRGPGSGVPC